MSWCWSIPLMAFTTPTQPSTQIRTQLHQDTGLLLPDFWGILKVCGTSGRGYETDNLRALQVRTLESLSSWPSLVIFGSYGILGKPQRICDSNVTLDWRGLRYRFSVTSKPHSAQELLKLYKSALWGSHKGAGCPSQRRKSPDTSLWTWKKDAHTVEDTQSGGNETEAQGGQIQNHIKKKPFPATRTTR